MAKDTILVLPNLSKYGKYLIESNLEKIRIFISKQLRYVKIPNKNIDIINEALGYLPEITIYYDKTKTPEDRYYRYAGFLCVRRLLDDFKLNNKVVFKCMKDKKNICSIDSVSPNSFAYEDQQHNNIFWNETKDKIAKEFEKYDFGSHKKIIKTIIFKNIIPKSQGENYYSQEDIAKEFNVSEGCVSQIVNSSIIKDFFKKVLL